MMQEPAVELARRGFRVHPLKDRDKRPLLRDWPVLASSDPDQVKDLWRDRPLSNIGIATGRLADGRNFFVLDVDDANALEDIQDKYGQLPSTLTAQTARGGWHIYLLSGGHEIRNRQNVPAPGLDIRGVGGYVVAPPSIGTHEAPYVWAHEAEIAMAPEWLLDLLKRRTPIVAQTGELPATSARLQRASAYLQKLPEAIAGQGGHAAAWRAALTVVRGFALDEESAYKLLADSYNPRCQPPWSESELRHKIVDAAKSNAPLGYKLAPDAEEICDPAPPHLELVTGGNEGGAPTRQLKSHGPSLSACCRVLENDDLRTLTLGQGALRWNEMLLLPEFNGEPIDKRTIYAFRVNAERRVFGTDLKTGERKVIAYTHDTAKEAFVHVSACNAYHPVREWLASLPKVPRGAIELAAKEAMGVGDTLSLLLWRKWLIGCVARIMKPGCQMDTVLTLVAPSGGQKKSTFLRTLIGDKWFSDTHLDMAGFGRTNAYMQLHRVMVYEVPELEICESERERSRIKSFITSRSDDFRSPYDEVVRPHPRGVSLAATTNSLSFLSVDDPAFNRRFWPVMIPGVIDVQMIAALREQIWSEARDIYESGEEWHLEDESVLDGLRARHEEFSDYDAWEDRLGPWLDTAAEPITTERMLYEGLMLHPKDQTKAAQMRAAKIARACGYTQVRRRLNGRILRTWMKIVPTRTTSVLV